MLDEEIRLLRERIERLEAIVRALADEAAEGQGALVLSVTDGGGGGGKVIAGRAVDLVFEETEGADVDFGKPGAVVHAGNLGGAAPAADQKLLAVAVGDRWVTRHDA